MIKKNRANLLLSTILALDLLLITITLILCLNKGYDFTDEGGFLLSFKHPEIYRGGVYNYHLIITALTGWLHPGIIGYRWMSLIITLASSYIIGLGCAKWLATAHPTLSKNLPPASVILFMAVGNMLYFLPGIPLIYNNTLTNFFLETVAGLLLLALAQEHINQPPSVKYYIFLALAGFLCPFSFFTKFSSGILQFAGIIIVIIFYKKRAIKITTMAIAACVVGCWLGALIYFASIQSFHEWHTNFLKEYSILSDHTPGALFKRYYSNIHDLVWFMVRRFYWLGGVAVVALAEQKMAATQPKIIRRVFWIIYFAFFAYFLILLRKYGFYKGLFGTAQMDSAYLYMIIIVFLAIWSLWLVWRNQLNAWGFVRMQFGTIVVVLFLFFTPFVGAFGTANPLFLNAACHGGGWFGVILVLSLYIWKYAARFWQLSILSFVSIVATLQVVDGNVYHPYYAALVENKKSFKDQQITPLAPALRELKIDRDAVLFIDSVYQIAKQNNIADNTPILGVNIPGIVYALNGYSPGVPFYFGLERDQRALDLFRPQDRNPVIIQSDKRTFDSAMLAHMEAIGIHFPECYRLAGSVYFPNDKAMLRIYFPINRQEK